MVGVDTCSQAKVLCAEDLTFWSMKPPGPHWRQRGCSGAGTWACFHSSLYFSYPESQITKAAGRALEVFLPGIDLATKAISQEGSMRRHLQHPLFHSNPRPCYALPTSLYTTYCTWLPKTQERERICIIDHCTSLDKTRSVQLMSLQREEGQRGSQ